MNCGHETVLERLAIRDVLERYCTLLDTGQLEQLLGLFEDDCTVTMMGQTYVGKSEFAQAWGPVAATDQPSTLHALVNPDITVDGDNAVAVSGWILVDRAGEGAAAKVALAGRYHDALRRSNDRRWRFASRRVQALARPRPS